MSKILLALSILLMAGAAVLGFLTQAKVKAQSEELVSSTQKLTQQESALTKAKSEAKDAADQAAAAKAERDGMSGQIAASKAAAESAKATADAATQDVARLTKELTDAKANPAGTPAITEEGPDVAELKKQLADSQAALTEAKQVRDSMQERANSLETKSAELQKYKDQRTGVMAASGLQGQVLAVNQAWSFVVLSIGDRQGVITNAEMLITRGGEQIAKVKVSSVEPGSAVADIVAGSLKSGVTVQPGDTVIYQGS